MSQQTTPYPLNPNLSCVERVRRLFVEINKRRLIDTARVRPADARLIMDWIHDIRNNFLPCFALTDDSLKESWAVIKKTQGLQDFVLGLCYEMRIRCFEDPTDFDAFIEVISVAITQFNDELSVIEDSLFEDLNDTKGINEKLAGNIWVLPLILYEQLSVDDLALPIVDAEIETAIGRSQGDGA